MNVYVFGNLDYQPDSWALNLIDKLKIDFPLIIFVYVKPNQDLPFENEEKVYLLDQVEKLNKVDLISLKDFDQLQLSPRTSAHEFDLGFQLKYLKKLRKVNEVNIIGIPMTGNYNYDSIHSIFKKLVAQDMQGS